MSMGVAEGIRIIVVVTMITEEGEGTSIIPQMHLLGFVYCQSQFVGISNESANARCCEETLLLVVCEEMSFMLII